MAQVCTIDIYVVTFQILFSLNTLYFKACARVLLLLAHKSFVLTTKCLLSHHRQRWANMNASIFQASFANDSLDLETRECSTDCTTRHSNLREWTFRSSSCRVTMSSLRPRLTRDKHGTSIRILPSAPRVQSYAPKRTVQIILWESAIG